MIQLFIFTHIKEIYKATTNENNYQLHIPTSVWFLRRNIGDFFIVKMFDFVCISKRHFCNWTALNNSIYLYQRSTECGIK